MRLATALVSAAAISGAGWTSAPAFAAERSPKPVPSIAKLKVDGNLKDLAPALSLKMIDSATAAMYPKLAATRDGLAIGINVRDDQLTNADVLDVSLQFPGAGTTARGSMFRFSQDGQRSPDPEFAAPVEAQKLVQAQVKKTDGGMALEILIPVKAFPRFPVKEPLVADLCLTYEDHDEVGAKPVTTSNCTGGSMTDGPIRLPDALRTNLKLKPSANTEGLEWHAGAWLGYGNLHFPVWVDASQKLTVESLRTIAAEAPVDPQAARIAIPGELATPKNGLLYTVLSGSDPYAQEGKCDADKELRLGVYRVKGNIAERVLEWPAATCALGRATSVSMEDEGALTIGYSNGATVHFQWSGGQFERTEIGKR